MIFNIKSILGRFGIDGPIFFTLLSRVFQGLGGFITIFMIGHFMSQEVQGFYYTFASVLAIQIFFELGLGGIIIQFVAHEMAFLNISDKNVVGPQSHISRLSSLLHFITKWYLLFSALLLATLIVVGLFFFRKYGAEYRHIDWQTPWILISVITAFNLLLSPWTAVFQGMNKVKEIAKIALIQQIIVSLLTWLFLFYGAELYILVINAASGFIVLLLFYYKAGYFHLVRNIYKNISEIKINYKKEILPLQWRTALSWISGYFIFQLFNPVIFANEGPVVAGQAGMTLTVLNSILGLIVSWSSTKIPLWSGYIAKEEYNDLNKSYRKVLRDSTLASIICIAIFILFLLFLNETGISLAKRFLPVGLSLLLLLSVPVNNIVNIWATYLRCHKKEPFLLQAVIVGILCAASTLLLGKWSGVQGIVYGYLAIVLLVSLPLSLYIFIIKKKEYHG